ncbi:MAG: 1-acyl-sn-glycerol-3-phosphate acyltransferase [Thermoanaerobaculia bacterium]|jgi:1-acyl-sn-glycerol-3-phosphate acyltransferase
MWLVPLLTRICRFAVTTYYRFEVRGEAVPESGPLLVVANHPNGVVDPICVVVAAGRPIRYVAKEPIFDVPILGWLARGSGAIPVRRRQDIAGAEADNSGMFAAARAALASGGALGIFPEGISHDEPALTQLKTGAARIALGAATEGVRGIRILPVGLNYREKEMFRSRALACTGDLVEWSDLEGRPESDADAVRELTSRIATAIRDVTVNLERWEDVALIEFAEAVWSAEYGRKDIEDRHEGRIAAGNILQRLRQENPESVSSLAQALLSFAKTLEQLRLRPRNLDAKPSLVGVIRWIVRRALILIAGLPVIVSGTLVFVLPYAIVGFFDGRSTQPRDVRSTDKLLGGGVFYIGWITLLSLLLGWRFGAAAGLAAALGLPLLGLATQWLRERWGYAMLDVRRFFALRRGSLRDYLLARRKALATELDALL